MDAMDLPADEAARDACFEGRLEELIPRGYRLACGMLHDRPGAMMDGPDDPA